ncbi:hypothetical protein RQP46_009694 [Phenoliferia psychrophenolica]
MDAGSTMGDEKLASNAPFGVSIPGARDALPVDASADPAPLLDASTESATTVTPARDATAEEAEFRIPICPPLPLELRALVARFASIHDAEHKVRWAKGERGADLVSKVIRKWDGRALIALSETDRAFNVASHPYIFQEIAGKQASSQLFGPVFAPKFGSHMRSLSLLHQGTAAMGAISAFIVLPRLQKLTLSHAAANSLLGPSGLAADAVGNNPLATDLITSFANPTSVLEEIRIGLGKTLPGELTAVMNALELHSSTLLRTRVAYSGFGHGGPSTRPKLPVNVHLQYVPPPDMFWCRRQVETIEASSEKHQTFAAKQWADCLREVLGETFDQIWELQEAKDFKEMDKLFKTLATFRVRSLMTLPSV